MNLVVGKTDHTREDCTRFEIHYNKAGQAALDKPDSDNPSVGFVAWYLKQLTGADHRELSDKMMKGAKRGETKFLAGTVAKAKIMRATTFIGDENGENGIEIEGGERIEKLTMDAYGKIHSWLLEKVLTKINELNGDGEEDGSGED